MNAFKRITIFQKASAYLKFCGKLSKPLIAFLLIDGCFVQFYVGYNWRFGETRTFPVSQWRGYTKEQIESVIRKREPMISAIHDLFLAKEGVAKDPEIAKLFTEDCIYEDPNVRVKSGKRILSMFHITGRMNSIEFQKFQPRHYEDKIVIEKKCVFTMNFSTFIPMQEMSSKGNIVINLTHEGDGGTEKMKYITDEWNCVSLVQPKTHNVYFFGGSVAKFLRTSQAQYSYYRHKEDKSILNPFLILDLKDKLKENFNEKRERDLNNLADVKQHPVTDSDGKALFNAGRVEEPKQCETVSSS